jgi:hypothetical protein
MRAFLKGLLRLETLLESMVDLRFDQYEAYLHRNVFTIQPSLVPYLKLDHHPSTGLPDSLRGTDEALLKELDEERRSYEQELDEKHCIDLADERIQRRLEALMAMDAELSALGLPTEQHQGAQSLTFWSQPDSGLAQTSKDLAQLTDSLPHLLSSVQQLKSSDPPNALNLQLADRENYLQKAVLARLAKAQEGALTSSTIDKEDQTDGLVNKVKQEMAAAGSTTDAQVRLDRLRALIWPCWPSGVIEHHRATVIAAALSAGLI